jgi:hypothetical protein
MTGFVVDDAVKEDGNAATLLSSSLLNDLDRQFLKWRPSPLSSSAAAATIGLRMVGSYLDTNANMIPPLGVPEVAFLGRSNVGKSLERSRVHPPRGVLRFTRLISPTHPISIFYGPIIISPCR